MVAVRRLGLLLWILLLGCETPPAPPQNPITKVPTVASALGPGDVVEIKVFREPDLAGTYRISDRGRLDFPLIGEVEVAGRLPHQVEEDIQTRLADGFLVEPQVTVFVRETNSQKVHVLGQVRNPGSFPFQGGMTIIQAVTNAGGFTKLAATNSVTLTRVSSGKEESFRVKVGDIRVGKSPNVDLQPGDIIWVPEAIF